MALMDIIRDLLGGEAVQSVLESTGLADHVDALGGDLGAGAEALAGGDLGAGAEALVGGDLGAGAEALVGGDLGAGAEALVGGDLGAGAEALGSGLPDIADSLTTPP